MVLGYCAIDLFNEVFTLAQVEVIVNLTIQKRMAEFYTWRRRTGDQLKTWATTIKADLETLSGPRVLG